MKKKILALILVFIIMVSSTITFAYPNDIPKVFTPNRIPPHTSRY